MLSAKFSFFLCFYTLITKGAWRPVLKKKNRAYIFLFFPDLPRIRTSDREERKHIILTGDGLGEIILGGIKETGKSGRQIYWEVKYEIFTTYYYDTAWNYFAGLVLSIIKSVQVKPSLLRYSHIARTKNWDLDKGIEIRAGRRMGKWGQRYDTNLPLSKINLVQANNKRYPKPRGPFVNTCGIPLGSDEKDLFQL